MRSRRYIVEVDINGFFDNVDHEWMMKFLEHRIADTKVLRMIKQFLILGIMEDEELEKSERGTPQGGVISPLLANIYLHYLLDLWFEKVYRKKCEGYARHIRFCNNLVVCFQKISRTLKTADSMKQVQSKLRGHYNYYGVTDNSPGIARFYYEVERLLHKWLNRRGKRKCLNWDIFKLLLKRYPLPKPRVCVSLY